MKPHEFTVGTKFKYIGMQDGEPDEFISEVNIVREVLSLSPRFSNGKPSALNEDIVMATGGVEFGIGSPYAQQCEIVSDNNYPLYTAAEVLEIERKAFQAGRKNFDVSGVVQSFYYNSFEDYKAK